MGKRPIIRECKYCGLDILAIQDLVTALRWVHDTMAGSVWCEDRKHQAKPVPWA